MDDSLEQLGREFRERFASAPRFFRAPGRVNLIGEHTDYNDGFVMPFAIDRHVTVAGSAREDGVINVHARDMDESAVVNLADPPKRQRGSWIDYVEGTARCLAERFEGLGGADLLITSSVPIGGGLSSSAAIEVGVGLALLSLHDIGIDRKQLAFAAQQAEHEFAGIRSGIMDQFASAFGTLGNAMLLDCRSLEVDHIPIASDETVIAVFDSKVKHSLASTEYNTRRAECEQAVASLSEKIPNLTSLRDVAMDILKQSRELLTETVYRRAHHVISENLRTTSAADAFRNGEYERAGSLMNASHVSLRDDYEVSCPELDFLVDTALSVPGVHGARMTGGGFGGCTVNLLERMAVDNLRDSVSEYYHRRFGITPDFYLFQAMDGASELTV